MINNMYPRTSIVRKAQVISASQGGHIQIGDTRQIYKHSFAIAAQDANSTFIPGKHNFCKYEIFSRELTLPEFECMPIEVFHEHPCIYVDHVEVFSVAAASVLHIGSVESIFTDARIMHIRDFESGPKKEPQ